MYESTKQMICIASGGKLESDPVSVFETILITSPLIPIVRVKGVMSVCDIGNDRDRPPGVLGYYKQGMARRVAHPLDKNYSRKQLPQ